MGLLWTFFQYLQPYVGPAMMLGYPLFESIKAIESPLKEDDEQWLTYWVLYSFIALLELAAENVFEWIPLWPVMKLLAACWLVLPQFKGASFVYQNYVRRYVHFTNFKGNQRNEKEKEFVRIMSSEARSAAAQYISDHGQDAFEKLIITASKQAKSPKHSPIRSLFERKQHHSLS